MDDILAKKNRHLFLEEKDNQNNSFIGNINDVANRKEELDAVATHIESVDTVGNHINNVDTVANNISDINDAVDNIATVKTFNDNVNNGTMQYLLEAFTTSLNQQGNAWEVRLTQLGESILATTSAFNYSTVVTVSSDIPANGTLILPNSMKYKVGTHMLMVSWNGTVCYAGEQYEEVGAYGVWATSIKLNQPAKAGDKIQLRIVALTDQSSYVDITEAAINASQFVASGSNTERYLPEFLGDVVNVKNFGAVGNGVNDDTMAFRSATTSGKTVFVPAGTYKLTGEVLGDFVSLGGVAITGGGNAYVRTLTTAEEMSLYDAQQRIPDRLNGAGQIESMLYLPDGTDDWGINGSYSTAYSGISGATMLDPHTGDMYAAFGLAADDGSKVTMRRFRRQSWSGGEGWKCIASAEPAWSWTGAGVSASARVWAHQGYGLYKPTAQSPLRFFTGSYGPHSVTAPNWYTLRLVEWDGEDGTAPAVLQTWQLFDTSEFRADNGGDNVRMNVCLSPDMQKLVARGKRIHEDDTAEVSYGNYVYRVWDVKTLLAMSGDYADATDAYEFSMESPYGSFEADWQGLAYDGYNFYGLRSNGGYTPHEIRVWDSCGKIVAERLTSMEGLVEKPLMRQYEGEGLGLWKTNSGKYELFLSVSICSEDWDSNKYAGVYCVSNRAIDADSPLAGVVRSINDVDTATAPGLCAGEASAFNDALPHRGYVDVISSKHAKANSVIQIAYDQYNPHIVKIRYGTANATNPLEKDWSDWCSFLTLSNNNEINLYHTQLKFVRSTSMSDSYYFKTKFYNDERGGLLVNGSYTALVDTGQVCLQGGSELLRVMDNYIRVDTDNTCQLGTSNKLFKAVYAGTGAIQTSDVRLKTDIYDIKDSVMRTWGKLKFKEFKFINAVEEKKDHARIHIGLIAQDIQEAFKSEGLDASRFGLFCYDEWEDEYEENEIIDEKEVLDEFGKIIKPAKTHVERKLVQKAGNRYSIRYDEALALECAYQRWLGEQRDAKIEALMQRISALENNR